MVVLRGVVVEGKRLGRQLGFPTANVMVGDDLAVDNGVYMSRVVVGGVEYQAVSNVGVNPTVADKGRRVESYIFDFEGDIYGETIEVELLAKLRDERQFGSVEELRDQVLRDIELARSL